MYYNLHEWYNVVEDLGTVDRTILYKQFTDPTLPYYINMREKFNVL